MKQILILMALTLVLGASVTAYAAHEPGEPSHLEYPYGYDHMRAWYDDRQQYQIYGPAEPVYYPAFYIEPIGKVQCDNWIPVSGTVPNNGMLYFTIISGDYIGFHNVSHNGTSFLINYFWLPCEAAESYIYVTFIYNEDDKEIYPNTKAKNLTIDRPALHIEIPFTSNWN